MILIFGGTTEGRYAVKVCDEASKPFYYSTKGNLQVLESVNSVRLTEGMDEQEMIDFCKKRAVSLIIDAAHPFAELLHSSIAKVSKQLSIPVVRYERDYAEQEEGVVWFDSYDEAMDYLEEQQIDNLLALTGVKTIASLKRYWQRHNAWFRILDREESRQLVEKNGFPMDRIIYFENHDTNLTLFQDLKPEAIITKESGASGGFNEKIEAARQANIPILVVRRPQLDSSFISVYGENGLRKEIEKYVPGFFELRTGYTTGTCATAATKAALIALLTNVAEEEVRIGLPNGEQVRILIASTTISGDTASCSVIKDAGDDPDVTNKREIVSTVKLNLERKGVVFLQGEGVGVVTLPGLGLEIGGPAINKTPRITMRQEIFKVLRHHEDKLPIPRSKIGVDVTISVPDGRELARQTFNKRLGIEGGISIIGTSGVVRPFSADAFLGAIRKEMSVARALGSESVVIVSGGKSERTIRALEPDLPPQAFVHYGNFIGEAIKIASELEFKQLSLGIMLGKAVKLAEGALDTHSKKGVMNKAFLADVARQAGCSHETIGAIDKIVLARELWKIIPENEQAFFSLIQQKCYQHCLPLLPNGKLIVYLIGEGGEIVVS